MRNPQLWGAWLRAIRARLEKRTDGGDAWEAPQKIRNIQHRSTTRQSQVS